MNDSTQIQVSSPIASGKMGSSFLFLKRLVRKWDVGADERTISIQGVVPNEITNGMYEMELFVQDSIGNEAVGRYQFQVDRTSPDLILMLEENGAPVTRVSNQPGYALLDLMLSWNADAVPSTLLVTLADENQIFAFDTTVSGQITVLR